MLKSVEQHRTAADENALARGLKYKIAIYGSLIGNLCLAGLQLYGAVSSGSLSLFTTMVDSIFDPVNIPHALALEISIELTISG